MAQSDKSVAEQREGYGFTQATKHWGQKAREGSLPAHISAGGVCEICEQPGGRPFSDGIKGRMIAHPKCIRREGLAATWAQGVWDEKAAWSDAVEKVERRDRERQRQQERAQARAAKDLTPEALAALFNGRRL